VPRHQDNDNMTVASTTYGNLSLIIIIIIIIFFFFFFFFFFFLSY
jgi:hypothetical protein